MTLSATGVERERRGEGRTGVSARARGRRVGGVARAGATRGSEKKKRGARVAPHCPRAATIPYAAEPQPGSSARLHIRRPCGWQAQCGQVAQPPPHARCCLPPRCVPTKSVRRFFFFFPCSPKTHKSTSTGSARPGTRPPRRCRSAPPAWTGPSGRRGRRRRGGGPLLRGVREERREEGARGGSKTGKRKWLESVASPPPPLQPAPLFRVRRPTTTTTTRPPTPCPFVCASILSSATLSHPPHL